MEVMNQEALVERFGEWPSFHDAEIYGLRLDSGQRRDGVVRLELDIHLFSAGERSSSGRVTWVDHTLVTLEFEDVEALQIEDFNHQNVLFDLVLDEIREGGALRIEVTLSSSRGLSGGFSCRSIAVLDAVAFEPGPHSVYGR